MKLASLLLSLLLSIAIAPVFSQIEPSPTATAEQTLTKFDLDFPGGTPGELVAAIQKAMGRPLNAIIPEEHGSRRLPPLKMSRVDVSQLFWALSEASIAIENRFNIASQTKTGFFTTDPHRVSDETIWFFRVEGGPPKGWESQLKICRVYLLTPYLDKGLTVDDVTTAIRTAWKMIGDPSPSIPQSLTFHRETKLLIAVADQRSLEAIDAVLKALRPAASATSPPANEAEKKSSKP